MDENFLDPFIDQTSYSQADDFKDESMVAFECQFIPPNFTYQIIQDYFRRKHIKYKFIAIEKGKKKSLVLIGFVKSDKIPYFVHRSLLFLIKSSITVLSLHKITLNCDQMYNILKHRYDPTFTSLILKITKQNKAEQPTPKQDEIDMNECMENLPRFSWDTPIKEYSILQTEIEAGLNLFNDKVVVENSSLRKTFQNIGNEELMFPPHQDPDFIARICAHKSVFA
ncbi:hypothetical protein TRFO_38716 [Tritrichomonas foetus]|uniref:Uncharacterized protein n=1 Tax=Tritrichomonas foetus TaxID=1144522 RepID=A0A1J4J7I0_9EUKA|nr:hypothetical protein TRFO_38716 [Tritrichomonas foetus]|eukprot:OHS95096.1 hypothetical protein TRFO_38716 [Tritrichomonas foetus]